MRYVVGIDPGQKGGLAFVSDEHDLIMLCPMPVKNGETGKGSFRIDTPFIRGLIRAHGTPTKIFIEQVGPNAQWRKKSIFTFGRHYEALLALMDLEGYPHDLLPPKTWQDALLKGMKRGKSGPKPVVAEWVNRNYNLNIDVTKDDQDGLSDSLGICEVGWRRTFSEKK